MKKFLRFVKSIGPLAVMDFILNILSFGFAVPAFISSNPFFFVVASLFFVGGVVMLLYSIIAKFNKEKTVRLLIKDDRIMTVRLLLTYELYKNSPAGVTEAFQSSGLNARNATYSYQVTPSADSEGKFDLQCKYDFFLEGKQNYRDFNIMILQPRGKNQPQFRYSWIVNGKEEQQLSTSMKAILFDEALGIGFSGIMTGKICSPESTEDVTGLRVTFTLKNAFRPQEKGALLIFPFLYLKSLKSCNFEVDYSKITPALFPSSVTVDMAAYDGSKASVGKILDLQSTPDRSKWYGSLKGTRCRCQAIYILGTHPNKGQYRID